MALSSEAYRLIGEIRDRFKQLNALDEEDSLYWRLYNFYNDGGLVQFGSLTAESDAETIILLEKTYIAPQDDPNDIVHVLWEAVSEHDEEELERFLAKLKYLQKEIETELQEIKQQK